MKLLFKQNVNDEYRDGLVYYKGKTYDFTDERAGEIIDKLSDAVEIISEESKNTKNSYDRLDYEQVNEDDADADLVDAMAEIEQKSSRKKIKV